MERRSGIKVMAQLVGLVKPLVHVMAAAIFLGVTGYLCAIFLTILAGNGLIYVILQKGLAVETKSGLWELSIPVLAGCMAVLAVFRGILHYGEQACNHFIAFKLLAIIRPLASMPVISIYGRSVGSNPNEIFATNPTNTTLSALR